VTPAATRQRLARIAAAALASVAVSPSFGCGAEPDGETLASGSAAPASLAASPEDEAEARLRVEERALVAGTDFRRLDSADLGPDPIALVAVPQGFVGLLRGRAAVTLLGPGLAERARARAPDGPSSLAVSEGLVWVGSKKSARLTAYDASTEGALTPLPSRDVTMPELFGVSAVAASERCVYAADHERDRLAYVCGTRRGSVAVEPGPHRLALTGGFVVVASLEGHALTLMSLDASGVPHGPLQVTRTDGPFWGVAAIELADGTAWIAASGPEDAKLDRRGGSFAHVDSFVHVYRASASSLDHVGSLDVSDDGLVVPKGLALVSDGDRVSLDVTAYGSGRAARITWPLGARSLESSERSTYASVPGLAAVARDGTRLVGASTLLDAWVVLDPKGPTIAAIEPDRTDPESDLTHLGEALAFTTLIAPWQSSEGPLSRFTCETCHFEGGVDGRTHATGRQDSMATTKPLWGLFNNAPHFTRALDEDTAETVYAEFRVAGAKSDGPTWFSLSDVPQPWLRQAPWSARVDGSPEGLRRALLHWVRAAAPPASTHAGERTRFTELETEGARVFAERCEGCHAARTIASDPGSRVAPSEWESLVLSDRAPLVWARDGWEKTGVEPYVHPDGARPSSLRRIATRRPYFTTGAARSLEEVLGRARVGEGRFFHDHAPEGATALGEGEQRALRAFLELL
jgi:hypothetical protein